MNRKGLCISLHKPLLFLELNTPRTNTTSLLFYSTATWITPTLHTPTHLQPFATRLPVWDTLAPHASYLFLRRKSSMCAFSMFSFLYTPTRGVSLNSMAYAIIGRDRPTRQRREVKNKRLFILFS